MEQETKDWFYVVGFLALFTGIMLAIVSGITYFQSANIEGRVTVIFFENNDYTIYLSNPSIGSAWVECPNFISTIQVGVILHVIQYHAHPWNWTCYYTIIGS